MERGKSLAKQTLASHKVRFGLVGVVNTLVDFAILFLLAKLFGVPTVVANVISTSCAVVVSYTLNKKAVFGNTDRTNHRQVIQFVIVTLSGLWILQSAVILGITTSLASAGHSDLVLFVAKLIATAVSLVWNYMWYSRVVFRKHHEKTV